MPDNRVRLDFQFSEQIHQPPASFITQNPSRLVLDFVDTESNLDAKLSAQKLKIGSLEEYKVVSLGHRVRAILDLSGPIIYTGEISGHVYTLIINSKVEQLVSPRNEVFVTHRNVHAHYKIKNLSFHTLKYDM